MDRAILIPRLKTYLFGVAIGSILVALILFAKADMVRKERARADAAAQAAAHAAAQAASEADGVPARTPDSPAE